MSSGATPEREQAEALRTPEQMQWIRDRYKPDGLRRLARANRHYADEHGEYLPDVAALAHAEWERAESLTRALDSLLEWAKRFRSGDPALDPEEFYIATEYAQNVLAGGVSAAGRPPEQDFGGNTVAVAEERPTFGMPPDLVRVLRDPTITIQRDHEVRLADGRTLFEHLEEWRNAPSNTASALPPAAPEVLPETCHICKRPRNEPGAMYCSAAHHKDGVLLHGEVLPEYDDDDPASISREMCPPEETRP